MGVCVWVHVCVSMGRWVGVNECVSGCRRGCEAERRCVYGLLAACYRHAHACEPPRCVQVVRGGIVRILEPGHGVFREEGGSPRHRRVDVALVVGVRVRYFECEGLSGWVDVSGRVWRWL